VGVGLGEQVNLCNLIVVAAFDCGEDEGKEMFAVEKPASTKNVKHIEDTQVIERCNPTLFHWPPTMRWRQTSRLGGGRAHSTDLLAN